MRLCNILDVSKDFIGLLFFQRDINFYYPTIGLKESIFSLVSSIIVLLNIRIIKFGREKLIEEIKQKYTGKGYYLLGSARSGIYSLLKCLNLPEDCEVLITGFTCDVVANAVIQSGCKPLYVDINSETFGMDPGSLQKKITKNSKVIIIQHTFGIPAKLDELLAIANEYSLYVIEDCALSLDSYYKDKLTGNYGDAAVFTFELSKTITANHGGLLKINTDKLNGAERYCSF